MRDVQLERFRVPLCKPGADFWLTRITSLLNDPNTGSPANVEASNLYKDNRKEYTKRVRETVEKSWDD